MRRFSGIQTQARSPLPTAALIKAGNYNADDLYWLARIISAESRGESLDGKIAVGNVVLNRVASSDFPDTIYGVIFDDRWGGQFEPVRNGTIYQTPTEDSVLGGPALSGGQQCGWRQSLLSGSRPGPELLDR